jgi:hypothetical protein
MDRTTFKNKIEIYLDGRMSRTEKSEFEAYVNENEDAQEDLNFYKKLKDTVIEQARINKLQEISAIHEEVKTEKVRQNKRRRRMIYSSAALIILLVSALVIIPSISSDEELLLSGEFEVEGTLSESVLGADNVTEIISVNFFKRSENIGFREQNGILDIFIDRSEISTEIKIFRNIPKNEYLLIMNMDSIVLKELNE